MATGLDHPREAAAAFPASATASVSPDECSPRIQQSLSAPAASSELGVSSSKPCARKGCKQTVPAGRSDECCSDECTKRAEEIAVKRRERELKAKQQAEQQQKKGQQKRAVSVRTVFFSWQSQLPAVTAFLREALSQAIDLLNQRPDSEIRYELDEATRNRSGAPNIVSSILNKIDQAHIFVGDVTFTNAPAHAAAVAALQPSRLMPNPNVLIETGYALHSRGLERMILLLEESSGRIEQLPFDISPLRISTFALPLSAKLQKLKKQLEAMKGIDISLFLPDNRAAHAANIKSLQAKFEEELKQHAALSPSKDFVHQFSQWLASTEQSLHYQPFSAQSLSLRLAQLEQELAAIEKAAAVFKELQAKRLAAEEALQRQRRATQIRQFFVQRAQQLVDSKAYKNNIFIDQLIASDSALEEESELIRECNHGNDRAIQHLQADPKFYEQYLQVQQQMISNMKAKQTGAKR